MKCPVCNATVTASHFACHSGAKGGATKGKSKARTSEQARAAVMARWAKHKKKAK